MDDKLMGDIDHCLETWTEDQTEQALCIFKRMFRSRGLEDFDERYPFEEFFESPPLQCADYRREVSGLRLSCSTEELNIADTPPAERP